MRRTAIGFCFVAFLTFPGCSSDKFNRQPVSGTVTLKGKPVEYGQIFFEPAEGQQWATNAGIENGKFSLSREQGLSPGKYSWKLNVPDRIVKGEPGGGDGGGAVKNLVPDKANGGTFEVKANGENKLEIAIP